MQNTKTELDVRNWLDVVQEKIGAVEQLILEAGVRWEDTEFREAAECGACGVLRDIYEDINDFKTYLE